MWTISLPLKVRLPRKKADRFFPLNLNDYRNAHHHVLDDAKKAFSELAGPLIRAAGIPRLDRVELEYVLYPGTARLCDTNNICCIADKFFSDALVDHGVLEDDNYTLLAQSRFRFGEIDRENPRVDVVVRSPDHISLVPPEPLEEEPMKITTTTTIKLTAKDVEDALREYLGKHLTVDANAQVSIKETKEGYEIRLEQESEPKSATPAAATGKKKERLEPKAAMAALADFTRVSPVPESEKPAVAPDAEQEALPVVAEEKGHVEPEASQEEEKKPEAPPPPKTSSLFANFNRVKNG